VSSQVLAIFDKQAKDGQIDLRVEFQGVPDNGTDDGPSTGLTDHGPLGTGRLKDMVLWGDIHRILQVVINLVSMILWRYHCRCMLTADRSPTRSNSHHQAAQWSSEFAVCLKYLI